MHISTTSVIQQKGVQQTHFVYAINWSQPNEGKGVDKFSPYLTEVNKNGLDSFIT